MMEVVFPTDGSYDRDGDGLLDLEITFSDSGSGVDTGSISITGVRGIRGDATTQTNLMDVWEVVRADSIGLIVEETVENLLQRGEAQLQIRVQDREGNGSLVGVTVDLPPASLHKKLDLNSDLFLSTGQIQIGPMGEKAYVTIDRGLLRGSTLAIVDLATLTLETTVESPISALSGIALDQGRNRLYITSVDIPQVAVFDLNSRTFSSTIPTSNRGIGIVFSATRDEAYVGLEVSGPSNGRISVLDVASERQRTVWNLGVDVGQQLGMKTLLLDETESTLYAATSFSSQGVLEIDPDSGVLMSRVDVLPERAGLWGNADDLVLTGTNFAAAGFSPTGFGRIVVWPRGNPASMRFGNLSHFSVPVGLATSPDQMEYAVITRSAANEFSTNTLMDAATLNITWSDSTPSTEVGPSDVVFRPDGNVFLVSQGRGSEGADAQAEMWVYLRR